MQPKIPTVQINLLTYNGETLLKQCLDSVLKQTYKSLKITIIDNNSTDKTIDIIGLYQKKNPALTVLINKDNLGFSQGHNLGIARSEADFICCLNQDVVLDKDFIKSAVAAFQHRKIAAVQGKLLKITKGPERVIDTVGLKILKNRRIIAEGQGQKDRGQYEKMQAVFGADGAAPVYRRSALEDTKIADEYFDSDFFMYKEDVDLAWRLRLLGWHAVYQPKALAWHQRSAGESAALNYLDIVRERLKINQLAKYFAFKNQRLMQLKNEQSLLLLLHLPWFAPKEIASWIYVLLFERYTLKAIKTLFKQKSRALAKRKLIMAKKRTSARQMLKWFN